MQCKDGPFRRTDFSIGHRGAALQFPEHTKESYEPQRCKVPGLSSATSRSRATATSYAAMRRMTFYYDFDPQGKAIKKDSDMYKALDVLAREVKIFGMFSDWRRQ